MLKLNNCPFCGGKAYICKTTVLMRESYCIKCEVCEAQTAAVITGINLLQTHFTTSSEAAVKSVKRWNGASAV